MTRKLALVILIAFSAATLSGCAGDPVKMMMSNPEMQTKIMDAIVASPEMSGKLVDQLLGNEETRTMVLDNRGIAWLPQTLIAEDLAAGRLIAAASEEWCIPMEIRLYRDKSPMGRAAEDFWTAVVATSM